MPPYAPDLLPTALIVPAKLNGHRRRAPSACRARRRAIARRSKPRACPTERIGAPRPRRGQRGRGTRRSIGPARTARSSGVPSVWPRVPTALLEVFDRGEKPGIGAVGVPAS